MKAFERIWSETNPQDFSFKMNVYRDKLFENIRNPESNYMSNVLQHFDMKNILQWMNEEKLALLEEKHPENVVRFDWYKAYYFPDIVDEDWSYELITKKFPWINYGIAYVTKEWEEHRHDMSNAFNKCLKWKWIFLWSNTNYHWWDLLPGTEIEIPKYMLHWHQVIWEEPLVFAFIQECWVFHWMVCEWDFHLKSDL